MITERVIKEVSCFNGKIFGTTKGNRKLLGECEPRVRIYRQDRPVSSVGKASHPLKTYRIAVVLCGEPDLAPGVDYEVIQKTERYDLTAEVLLEGNEIRELSLSRLYPDLIDTMGEWHFTTEDPEKIREILSLDVIE